MITRITAGAKPWAAGRGEEALVCWLREVARGGGECQEEAAMRGLQGDAAKLRAAGGGEDAVVQRLRKGARRSDLRGWQEMRDLPD